MGMWEVIGTGLSLLKVLFGFYITKTKTESDLKQASDEFARAKSGINESAEDREDVLAQKDRLDKLKEGEEDVSKK
jgi:hypothetical protein